MEILWHAVRYRLSVTATAAAFVLSRQTVLNWRRVLYRRDLRLLPRLNTLPELVAELVVRLKCEWPRWGTRRIAGQLARLGVKASRSSVQRILRRPIPPRPKESLITPRARVLLSKRPDHIWMMDFTKVGGLLQPLWIGAVLDAFSRKVLAIGMVRGGPSARLATRLLQRAFARYAAPTWLVTDQDTALRNAVVNGVLRNHGTRRRYGAVGRKGSIAIIERLWRSLKTEYVRHLFLYRTSGALETRLRRWVRWHNAERPHQGLGQRTPDDVYRNRPPRATRDIVGGTLHVRFLDGDHRLPILRLRRAG
jgi:putative transposase